MDIGNYIATGGVSGAIMAGLYIAYKCCYRKKFKSSCCGASMDISADANIQAESPIERKEVHLEMPEMKPTPHPTPKPSPAPAVIEATKQPSELIL